MNSSSKRLEIMSSFSSSAEQIAGNKDILIQILLRLPAKSIIRFNSVSKQWSSLISGTWFSSEHIRRNPKPSVCGLFYDEPYNKGACPIPLQDGHFVPTLTFIKEAKVRIIDSTNGLVLCSYETSSIQPSQLIIVCNPTTQRYHKIREWKHLDRTNISESYLYFDPSLSQFYKVVLITIRKDGLNYNVSIYSSEDSTWKTIRLEGERPWVYVYLRRLLSSDGVIHMSTSNYHVKFNVATEQISEALVTYEPERPRHGMMEYFGESFDGSLVFIQSLYSRNDIMIYEMDKQEGGRWVLKHHLDLMQELNQPINDSTFAIMRVIWNGVTEDRDLTFVLAISGKVISYNLKRKETKMICDFPGSYPRATTYLVVHPFIESFNAV